ncbi:hypothetical protein LIX87_08425 [Weissella viridescens]|uniref:SLC13 family permease n=1 Tax=Weissella viridescens TaxID=1629 RepID=UPI001D0694D1|nr:SLC13 family permease [Weissella viridescens]MCB6841012.1 hypothetical protein [Weissella viridescens]MCB6847746.1 hypothetical protein [Weissella viridescens]
MNRNLKTFFNDKVFLVTTCLSILSIIFQKNVMALIDWDTVLTLFILLILVSIFKFYDILTDVSKVILNKTSGVKGIINVIFFSTFIGSMFFTNDAMILVMIPILKSISETIELDVIKISVLIAIFANLGSSVFPIGNPQNIYLMNKFHINIFDFLKMSAPIFFFTIFIILFITHNVEYKKVNFNQKVSWSIDKKKSFWLICVTLATVIGVLLGVTKLPLLFFVVVFAFLLDKRIFLKIDYRVIIILINFLIIAQFVGQTKLIENLLDITLNSPFDIVNSSVVLSQFISNVPSAVIVSNFTPNYEAVYYGVTMGGLGTLVASLANLLTYRQFLSNKEESRRFLKIFSAYNFLLLGIGVIFCALLFKL